MQFNNLHHGNLMQAPNHVSNSPTVPGGGRPPRLVQRYMPPSLPLYLSLLEAPGLSPSPAARQYAVKKSPGITYNTASGPQS